MISLAMMKPFSGQNSASLYKGLIFGSSIGGALLISLAIIGGCVHFKYNRVRQNTTDAASAYILYFKLAWTFEFWFTNSNY